MTEINAEKLEYLESTEVQQEANKKSHRVTIPKEAYRAMDGTHRIVWMLEKETGLVYAVPAGRLG